MGVGETKKGRNACLSPSQIGFDKKNLWSQASLWWVWFNEDKIMCIKEGKDESQDKALWSRL